VDSYEPDVIDRARLLELLGGPFGTQQAEVAA
jgi:hypothetical protein